MTDWNKLDPDKVWMEWFSTSAFSVEKRQRRLFRLLPHDPRCKFCNAPFEGLGGSLVKALYGKERSNLNPRYCNMCEAASRRFPGGNEVEMSILFADIRGSTSLSGTMSPTEFSRLINRFYQGTTSLIAEADGLVEKLAGDSVAAFWGAGFAGPDYVRKTVEVAQHLARLMQSQSIPVGIAVHAGVAYFGVMGGGDGLSDISAIGDEVNLAARICSRAAAGEILISEPALRQAGIEGANLVARSLELKGFKESVTVRVLRNGHSVAAA
jgi:adenylate cyclase